MPFVPRRGKYLRTRNGRTYYRRRIPPQFREFYSNRTEWLVRLRGQTAHELGMEASSLALRHNKALDELEAMSAVERKQLLMHLSENGKLPPSHNTGVFRNTRSKLYYEGELRDDLNWVVRRSLKGVRQDRDRGYEAMTENEVQLRLLLAELLQKSVQDQPPIERELDDLRAHKAKIELAELEAKKNGITISEAILKWHERDKQGVKTQQHHNQYLGEFIELFGDLYVDEICKNQVVKFVEVINKTPRKNGKLLTASSVAKRLECLKAFLAFCESTDLVQHNVGRGVKPPKDTRPKALRSHAVLSKEEIHLIRATGADLWSKRRFFKGTRREQDLNFALEMLVWTGARPEEVCQLRMVDLDALRGSIFITSDLGDNPEGFKPRSVKNENSIRHVPLHSKLMPSLEKHLDSLSGSNSPLLFPSFRPNRIDGSYCKILSREWTTHLRRATGILDHRKAIYSIRHSWAHESRRVGMPEHVRNAIMGHSNQNPIADIYGSDGDWLDEKKRQIERMQCV